MKAYCFAALMTLACVTSAFACQGQSGKVIFSDDFSDDSGGWDTDPATKIADGAFVLKASGNVISRATMNMSFTAAQADFCAQFVFPSKPPEDKNSDDAGLYVYGVDYKNLVSVNIDSDGEVWVNRKRDGVSQYIFPLTKIPSVKTTPGSVNEIRVIMKDYKARILINGEQYKVLRYPADERANKFGFWMGADKASKDERAYVLKSFVVTEPE